MVIHFRQQWFEEHLLTNFNREIGYWQKVWMTKDIPWKFSRGLGIQP
jgi:hypothetical protein